MKIPLQIPRKYGDAAHIAAVALPYHFITTEKHTIMQTRLTLEEMELRDRQSKRLSVTLLISLLTIIATMIIVGAMGVM